MGMAVGKKGGLQSDMNVTPMIDIVLVLLIIFMVMTPLTPRGYDIQIPKHDPRITMIKDRIDAEYAAERISVISDEEMFAWVREAFGNELPPLRQK